MPFFRPYEAPQPAPDAERTPEIIEAEMKALETAMEALVLVTLKFVCDSIINFQAKAFRPLLSLSIGVPAGCPSRSSGSSHR